MLPHSSYHLCSLNISKKVNTYAHLVTQFFLFVCYFSALHSCCYCSHQKSFTLTRAYETCTTNQQMEMIMGRRERRIEIEWMITSNLIFPLKHCLSFHSLRRKTDSFFWNWSCQSYWLKFACQHTIYMHTHTHTRTSEELFEEKTEPFSIAASSHHNDSYHNKKPNEHSFFVFQWLIH